ncbi:glycosyltransferase [Rhodomicrobium udaipurense]|uniref:Glycosyltransferase n=3 Tax=Rhodomicrobium udaipurense TaxID=1202716 RepID=A0A8I1GCS0_9HYPH|nr:glycosyltransferase [Rhodomicrobium udaipurense]MBJ7544683.1 glycosyltransferase [Rhodomicrobium udaipurense]
MHSLDQTKPISRRDAVETHAAGTDAASHRAPESISRDPRAAKTILFVQYTDPALYPPLERAAWMLAAAGWRVRFIGIAAENSALTLAARPGISCRLLRHRSDPVSRLLSYARFAAACIGKARRLRPDVVYCSDFRSFPIGLALAWTTRVKTVLHEHDSPIVGGGLAASALLKARSAFARRATLCVIPQDERAARFRSATGAARVVVANNCPSLAELVEPAPKRDEALALWYHGSISPDQFPETLIDAMRLLPPDVRLDFAGYETVGNRGYVDRFLGLAEAAGLAARVRYLGAFPERAKLLERASEAHIGLALFARAFREPIAGASNKPFDYLACGLPLLTNDTAEWDAFFGKAGVSVGCDPSRPEDIARAVTWYRNNPDERRAMTERGRQKIRDVWNYETQFAQVIEALNA